jgi:serine/threonine protein kinase
MPTSTAREFQKPVLLVAAESIVLASGMKETVAEVLRARALEHYRPGIRQYLAIRLGSRARADAVLARLEKELEEVSSEALATHPGPRAHLYRMARSMSDEQPEAVLPRGEGLSWMLPGEHVPHSYVAALARVRKELHAEDRELLELRYARELSPEELAFVVGRTPEDVITSLERAASMAAGILGSAPPSRLGGLRGAFQEAFALAPFEAGASGEERGRLALPEGTVIGERYAVRERVGEGSFGDVYRATDTDVPGHVVALKLLHKPATSDEARKAALRELRLIASVFHPSVVDFKDHGWHEDRLWFVMPWYEGETLEERLRRSPLSRREAEEIFLPLCEALATMHAAGIRHQDIKPDNIFLARLGEGHGPDGAPRLLPVLIDLGVAAKEAELIVAGTPLYFPPEIAAQYAGKAERPPVTTKADVFSLALSLRNALEPSTQEQVPGTAVEAFIAHRAETPPDAPMGADLRYLAPFFARWMARDAERRPTARELADELSVLTRPERARQRRRSIMRWAVPIGLGSVLGLSSVTYGYLEKRAEAKQATLRAEVTEDKLDQETERRMQLAESYQDSELSRQELAERLTKRDHEVEKQRSLISRVRRLNDELVVQKRLMNGELEAVKRSEQAAQRKAEQQAARLTALSGELFSNEQRRAFLESELREARSRQSSAEQELDQLRTRAHSLLAELDRARAEASGHNERVEDLQAALANARAERDRAQDQLSEERARRSELERQLRRESTAAAAAATP